MKYSTEEGAPTLVASDVSGSWREQQKSEECKRAANSCKYCVSGALAADEEGSFAEAWPSIALPEGVRDLSGLLEEAEHLELEV